jgi:hypothetical protein
MALSELAETPIVFQSKHPYDANSEAEVKFHEFKNATSLLIKFDCNCSLISGDVFQMSTKVITKKA